MVRILGSFLHYSVLHSNGWGLNTDQSLLLCIRLCWFQLLGVLHWTFLSFGKSYAQSFSQMLTFSSYYLFSTWQLYQNTSIKTTEIFSDRKCYVMWSSVTVLKQKIYFPLGPGSYWTVPILHVSLPLFPFWLSYCHHRWLSLRQRAMYRLFQSCNILCASNSNTGDPQVKQVTRSWNAFAGQWELGLFPALVWWSFTALIYSLKFC